ncbi:putative 2-(5''-triphosphoribosyl)-3'-dephosphocoenzyme-A synthase [Microtetraspora sp. NBRC 13810]|uniref:triphosphoribosyl-dephospho-CoA synthase n=1 Tax=Microtetraspora sp. NBRC 13810 TaxID=3030990 RepID=UPI0024A47518|nr:triphosphoribosyl-dephospho-CoA synthase [Microtetraspora sp. NBRC 13810]GLW11307.1 putative 2-(5''-triphosphoribosyl)-3'-dephosphocoenzyme-A synthase [Microtetraspora sp. NBRC 13810]
MTATGRDPGRTPRPSAAVLADGAVRALRGEALLSPKPGLVDRRGGGAHDDMDLPLLLASAEALRATFRSVADAAERMAVGIGLREELGRLGRMGDRTMLRITRGVNTHRGALWALGLLVAAAGRAGGEREAARGAALLAALPDRRIPPGTVSHGERARRRYGVRGARSEAEAAFPHVIEVALPRLRRARAAGLAEEVARLDALLEVMSLLDDTCVLHRGGLEGLRVVRHGAERVLAEGGAGTVSGRAALMELDERLRSRRLSPGGSGDLLAAALFLDTVPWQGRSPHTGREVLPCRR